MAPEPIAPVTIHGRAIQERLLSEYQRRKSKAKEAPLTMDDLLAESGLKITRSALHRKLHGKLHFTLEEAQEVARALGVRIDVSVKRAV